MPERPEFPAETGRLSQESDLASRVWGYPIVFSAICGLARECALRHPLRRALIAPVPKAERESGEGLQAKQSRRAPRRTTKAKISCEQCFFRVNLLCALGLDEPCATFRPSEAELRPPQQMRLVFRQERRTRAAWSFPSAEEQAALHA